MIRFLKTACPNVQNVYCGRPVVLEEAAHSCLLGAKCNPPDSAFWRLPVLRIEPKEFGVVFPRFYKPSHALTTLCRSKKCIMHG